MAIEKKNHFKIVLAPGNGAGDVTNCLWYPDLVYEMKRIGIPVILRCVFFGYAFPCFQLG